MYLMVIHVPFQAVRPGVARVSSDWGRALLLLRDSFQGAYGSLLVAAPALAPDFGWTEQLPVELEADRDQIDFVPLCPAGLRVRQFLMRARGIYRRCRQLAAQADLVHCGMSDLYRPVTQLGFLAARRAGRPVIIFEDTDTVTQLQQLSAGPPQLKARLYCWTFERVMRYLVARADLAFLKGQLLMDRYARFAPNPKGFLNTSHSLAWVITEDQLAAKRAELSSATTLRCVSIGRLIARKGVDHSLRTIGHLRQLGVPVTLDIIGNGPERAALEAEAQRSGLSGQIRFLDAVPYGHEMLRHLQSYQLMLFTPTAEDTPRSLFDALAAGVPVAGYAIDFLREVITPQACGLLATPGDPQALAREIQAAWLDRTSLDHMTARAAVAGRLHAAESWYERRARWTLEIAPPARQSK